MKRNNTRSGAGRGMPRAWIVAEDSSRQDEASGERRAPHGGVVRSRRGRKPCPGKRRERLAATRCVSQVVKEAAASRLGSRRKTARIRMQMATTQRANRELHYRANQCRCHEPARGHFWDPVTLRCTNGSCTRTWSGQQMRPTDCEHRRSAPWERTPDASPTGSMRDAGHADSGACKGRFERSG